MVPDGRPLGLVVIADGTLESPSVSRSNLGGSLHSDAAARRSRVKAGAHPLLAEPLQNSLEQMQVHAADQLGVFLGKSMERAVAQDDVASREMWLEAVGLEQAHQNTRVALA